MVTVATGVPPVRTVQAVSVGALLKPFSGTVLSVHRGAINIQAHDDGHQDRAHAATEIVSVVDDRAAMTVTSVCVSPASLHPPGLFYPPVPFHSPRRQSDHLPQAGDPVVCEGDLLRLGSRLSITLSGTPIFDGSLVGGAKPSGQLLLVLADTIAAVGTGAGLSGLAPYAVARSVDIKTAHSVDLRAPSVEGEAPFGDDRFIAVARRCIDAAVDTADTPWEALSDLVGLGIGMTPSGDDFVVGFLAAKAVVGRGWPSWEARQLLEGRAAGTTPAGATILRQALRGQFPAYLVDFALGLAAVAHANGETCGRPRRGSGCTDPVEQSEVQAAGRPSISHLVEAAAAHGHSSGLDALTGFVFGLGLDIP